MNKIDNYKYVSTTKGDKGTSKNYSNVTYSKSDLLFETLGSIDELSSVLGIVYHQTTSKVEIKEIQLTLQHIGSLIATSKSDVRKGKLTQIDNTNISKIETLEQYLIDHCSIEPKFVLPGSDTSIVGAYFDLARSVTRRAERNLVRFVEYNERNDLDYCIKYLNRLSDLLFLFARSLA